MFAFATSHSLLLTLFAGYARPPACSRRHADRGVLGRQLPGRRGPLLDRPALRRELFARLPRLERAVQVAARLADRHNVWMILFHRYPHGLRGVAGFAYGMSRIPWPTFLVLNFIAAGLWACAVVSAGYAFGRLSEKVMNDASSGFGIVMLVAFLGLSWILSRKLERAVERS